MPALRSRGHIEKFEPLYRKRNRDYGKGRVCEACDAILSRYNSGRYCSVHATEVKWSRKT